jgi:hypothetical protein
MISKIFSPKNLVKKLAFFLLKILLVYAKKWTITLFFLKSANFFSENKEKSQNCANFRPMDDCLLWAVF